MSIEKLKDLILPCVNDVYFVFNGKNCGVSSQVNDYIPIYECWYGDTIKEYSNVDDLINDLFFDGKSIADIIQDLEISIS